MKRLPAVLLIAIVTLYTLWPRDFPETSKVFAPSAAGGSPTTLLVPGAPLVTLSNVPLPSTPAEPASSGLGVRSDGGAPHPTSMTVPVAYGVNPDLTEPPVMVSNHLSITGDATYYCRPGISRCTRGYPQGMYAAAGPELRAMLGDWRGRFVIVTDANGRGVVVQLIDTCWCPLGSGHVIDLYWSAYQGMVNPVTVKEEP